MLELSEPLIFSEKGIRDGNEDSVFPSPFSVSAADRLFMVCDGMGGAERGEVASALVCQVMPQFLFQSNGGDPYQQVELAFNKAQEAIDAYVEKDPAAKGMGTTLTLVWFVGDGVFVAHCGDSRIYQIRDREVVFKTQDHSYVNELLKRGMITLEQSYNHPRKNVITRAMQGEQVKKVEPEIVFLEDLKPQDRFFLCSDGVIDALPEPELLSHLTSSASNEEIVKKLQEESARLSKDNYSGILLSIKHVNGEEDASLLKKITHWYNHLFFEDDKEE